MIRSSSRADSLLRLSSIIGLACAFSCLVPRLSFSVDIIPVNEVKVGMKGHALTVFQGTAIEEFPVEVVGIYPNFAPQRSVILVRLGGKADFTGVVAGMSGSPVFLEGRLAGALAYRFMLFGKEAIAGVTPIEEMLAVKEREKFRDKEEFPVPVFDRASFQALLSRDYSAIENRLQKSISPFPTPMVQDQFQPLPILLTVTGAGRQTLDLVKSLFASPSFEVAVGAAAIGWEGGPLVPGSALAVVLMDGDLGLAATGTVTYADAKEVFGFGHPFFEIGPSRLPMAQSTIIYTMSSDLASFKLAAPGKVVGTLRQDRFPAIYGTLGDLPPMAPIKVSISLPWGETRTFSYRFAEDYRISSISPILTVIALINSVESARESFSDNAIFADLSIRVKKYGDLKLSDFYGGSLYAPPGNDTTLFPFVFDLLGTLSTLYGNGFEFINLESIDINLRMVPGRRVAEILDVGTPRTEARPGDTLPVFVKVRPFMKPPQTLKFSLKIPESAPAGSLRILIGDSSAAMRDNFRILGNNDPESIGDILRDLRESLVRRRDRLYVRFTRPTQGLALRGRSLPDLPPSISSIAQPGSSARSISQVLLNEIAFPLDYEIIGSRTLFVKIKQED